MSYPINFNVYLFNKLQTCCTVLSPNRLLPQVIYSLWQNLRCCHDKHWQPWQTDVSVIHCIVLSVSLHWHPLSMLPKCECVLPAPLLFIFWLMWLDASSPTSFSKKFCHGIVGMPFCMAVSLCFYKKNQFLFNVFFFFSFICSWSVWLVLCSLKCSPYQKPRQHREMILQWMWTSHLLWSRTLHLWV